MKNQHVDMFEGLLNGARHWRASVDGQLEAHERIRKLNLLSHRYCLIYDNVTGRFEPGSHDGEEKVS